MNDRNVFGESIKERAFSSQMTYADVVLFDVLGRMADPDDPMFSKFEAASADNGRVQALGGDVYPKLRAMMDAVAENEGIKKYLESRWSSWDFSIGLRYLFNTCVTLPNVAQKREKSERSHINE